MQKRVGIYLRGLNGQMSIVGQTRTPRPQKLTSGLPPEADIHQPGIMSQTRRWYLPRPPHDMPRVCQSRPHQFL
jgi:hypothetical protein